MTRATSIEAAEVRDVRVSEKTLWRHVVLRTSDGTLGLGEATLDRPPEGLAALLSETAGRLVGGPATPEALAPFAAMLRGGIGPATVFSALEQALTALAATAAGLPVARHLGTAVREAVPLYANINRATVDRRPPGFAATARRARADGFTAFKLAPFDGVTVENCETPEGEALTTAGLERIRAVAEVAGGLEVMVDCHWRFTPAATRALIAPLREAGVCWLECPIPETEAAIDDLVDLRRRANAAGMRLTGLETFAGWDGFAPYVERGAYDAIMPDIKHAGGYAAILEIARKAGPHGVAVSLHNPTGPVAHLASVALSTLVGGGERLELQYGESETFFRLTDPAPDIAGGHASPVSGARLGVRPVNELAAGAGRDRAADTGSPVLGGAFR